MTLNFLNLIIAALATWRLASLVANEDGAFGMFYHFRHYARRLTVRNRFWRAFKLYQGVTCEWCNSVWIAAAITLLLGWHPLTILAMSALSILFKYVLQTFQQADRYLDQANKRLEQQPNGHRHATEAQFNNQYLEAFQHLKNQVTK